MAHLDQFQEPPRTKSTVESLKVEVDGQQIHCLKAGSGPPIVLMHGGASNSQDWAETIDALSHSYTLYAPDMIGYGLSDKSKESYYLSDFVKVTQGLFQKLGLSSMALVGHSLGGRVCLEIAFLYPDVVTGLVLVNTMGFAKVAWWGSSLAAAAWTIRKVLGRPQPYPKFLIEPNEDRNWRCLDRLPSLKVPTLLVSSRRDPYFSISGAFKAMRLIPHARLEVFPGYSHTPHMQRRESFNRLLLSFLGRA
jgi:pimeloyl-ACP methyl ester carboxylesterase